MPGHPRNKGGSPAGGATSSEALARLCEDSKACRDPAIAVQSAYLLSLAPSEWQEKLRSIAEALR